MATLVVSQLYAQNTQTGASSEEILYEYYLAAASDPSFQSTSGTGVVPVFANGQWEKKYRIRTHVETVEPDDGESGLSPEFFPELRGCEVFEQLSITIRASGPKCSSPDARQNILGLSAEIGGGLIAWGQMVRIWAPYGTAMPASLEEPIPRTGRPDGVLWQADYLEIAGGRIRLNDAEPRTDSPPLIIEEPNPNPVTKSPAIGDGSEEIEWSNAQIKFLIEIAAPQSWDLSNPSGFTMTSAGPEMSWTPTTHKITFDSSFSWVIVKVRRRVGSSKWEVCE